jgi:excinuclease ABC subunit B
MRMAIDETNRRRTVQLAYNELHGIVPASIIKSVHDLSTRVRTVAEEPAEYTAEPQAPQTTAETITLIIELEARMKAAARQLEFETAAGMRDRIHALRASINGAPAAAAKQQRSTSRKSVSPVQRN